MRLWAQWTAIVVGPLAWLVFLEAEYALVPWACDRAGGQRLALIVLAAVMLAAALAGAVLAWREWITAGRRSADAAPPAGRAAFMALAGLGSSALFAFVIAASSLPIFLLRPCD